MTATGLSPDIKSMFDKMIDRLDANERVLMLAAIEGCVAAEVRRERERVAQNQKLSDDEVQELIDAALAISDKLGSDYDHASFSGSMNDAEDFKETVQRLWWRSCRWREETKTQTRKDIEAAQAWVREYEAKYGPLKDPPLPDFMVPF